MTGRTARLRATILVTAAAVALVGAPSAGAGVDAATIDTYSEWTTADGTIQPFGHPDSSTYGQVITVPAGKKKVKWFTYYMRALGTSGVMKMRGEVYGWDGTKATEEIAETKAKTLDVSVGDPAFHAVKFKFKNRAKVSAGDQVVLFATISKDYEETAPGVGVEWPVWSVDKLDGGHFVFMNDVGDESLWTTQAWAQIDTYDNAFKAKLR